MRSDGGLLDFIGFQSACDNEYPTLSGEDFEATTSAGTSGKNSAPQRSRQAFLKDFQRARAAVGMRARDLRDVTSPMTDEWPGRIGDASDFKNCLELADERDPLVLKL